MSSGSAYIFGYASLVAGAVAHKGAQLVHVDGFRRTWNVAMDNRATLPGYKYYLDEDGNRPAIYVTFLNVVEDLASVVNGVLLPVEESGLEIFDERERSYERLDITDRVMEPVEGPVWTYIGSPEGRRRYEEGARSNRAVVSLDYYNLVLEQFRTCGEAETKKFHESTDEPACAIVDLQRVDL